LAGIVRNRSRIGIFGGTFDPPHRAHLSIANQAEKQFGLDKIFFVPAFIPPHKRFLTGSNARDRLEMVKLATKNMSKFKVSDIELKRHGISYTIDTLRAFKKKYRSAELVLIIGADNLDQFDSWRSKEMILQYAKLAVYNRNGHPKALKNKKIKFLPIKGNLLNISSTQVRNRIRKRLSISKLVPSSVEKYIREKELYKLTH
jgi:nicotinate-nucleotide adenylyltransferase